MQWGILKSYLDEILEFPHHIFSRDRHLNFQNQEIETDCIGVIHLLLEKFNLKPFDHTLKAWEVYEYLKANQSTHKVYHLKEGMILGWRKLTPPAHGDTGHFCIIYSSPRETLSSRRGSLEYKLDVFEVTKATNGPRLHEISLQTDMMGNVKAIRWSQNKWKETQIIAADIFCTKRMKCHRCSRVYSLCLCPHLPTPKWKAPQISIIRHPLEKKHPLNSVQLLEQSFQDLKVWDQEIISPQRIGMTPLLVYPSEKAISLEELPKEKLLTTPIILLDGTWKKTKRILYQNPWLNDLTHIKISREAPPLYKIRKEISDQHYSTLEVFSHLWKRIAPHELFKANRLEEVFTQLINQQISKMGADRYSNNYQHYPGFKKKKNKKA